ncbi:MAG: alpha/beta hydrolase-fold protein [Acidobacteriota bacterium]
MIETSRFPLCRVLVALLLPAWAATVFALAQAPGRPAPVVSPEVLADHRVTFRIRAPKASDVILSGDWMEGAATEKLTKGEDGVWSVTVGPLVPDFYSYSLVVDGVKTLDPPNPLIKQGIAGVDSMFFVPGPEAAFEDNSPAPHGQMRLLWYHSTTLGVQRRMHVYTPPGYDASSKRYPVFYLLHGAGDDDSGWSTIGRAGFILDNLIAEKKAQPMIVVMPNGSLPMPANLPRPTPGTTPPPELAAAYAAARARIVPELMKEVIPQTERNFRVRADRENRAIAGLSMGGGHALQVVTAHPDQFAYVAVWSAGIGQNPTQWESANAGFLTNPKINSWIRLFSISVGDKDFTLAGSKNLQELLNKHGIKSQIHISDGGHTWINWRRYLRDLAPRLFKPLS